MARMGKNEREKRKTIGEWIKELQKMDEVESTGRINLMYFRLKMFLTRLYNLFKCLF